MDVNVYEDAAGDAQKVADGAQGVGDHGVRVGERPRPLRKVRQEPLTPPSLDPLGDVVEEDGQAIRRGGSPDFEPRSKRREELLERHGGLLVQGAAVLALKRGPGRVWELVPDHPAEQVRPAAREQPLRLGVDVGEAPPGVQGEEGVGDVL